ncbi:MAG: peptidase C39 family protein [Candidatus Harrisonbacteria bacterium]|nr:peptidase C39 family protein [Candidatus Harrisonbacteria bacterium]
MKNNKMEIKLKIKPRTALKNTCGPTSLRMVLSYYGIDAKEKEIIKAVGGLKKFGIRTIKLAQYAKKLGFKCECLSYEKKLSRGFAKIKKPDVNDILKFLKRGVPVIIAVNQYLLYGKGKDKKMGHFIVITGYKKDCFWYNDPWDGKLHKINLEDLKLAWYNNILDSSAYLLAIWPKYGYQIQKN